MNELALFAGAGGGILGAKILGWRTVCAVELNAFCARRLMQRQNEGYLPPFPIWDDVRTFDGWPWRGIVDLVSGGFPCTDISVAGAKAGLDGAQSGLWREMRRIISEVRPRFAFVENSPALTIRGGLRVVGDLTEMGYDSTWGIMGSDYVGACHHRARIWVAAHANRKLQKSRPTSVKCGEMLGKRLSATPIVLVGGDVQNPYACGIPRVDDDVANRLDRIHAVGNGQNPAVVRLAWNILTP